MTIVVPTYSFIDELLSHGHDDPTFFFLTDGFVFVVLYMNLFFAVSLSAFLSLGRMP